MWTEIRDLSDNTLVMFIHLGWSLKKNKKNADSGTCSSAMYFYLDELEEADSGYSPPADQSYMQHLALESFSPAPFCTTYGSNQQISLYCKKKKLFKREKKKKKRNIQQHLALLKLPGRTLSPQQSHRGVQNTDLPFSLPANDSPD